MRYHFVWIPKRRRKILVGDVKKMLSKSIRASCKDLQCKIIAMQVMSDHVHLFVSARPLTAPNTIIGRIKGVSSRLLRKNFSHLKSMPSLWTRSYFVSTAGNVSSKTVQKYIEDQHA
jgi:putative transposase